jgi:predicted Zn-dependent protease
MIKFRGMLSLLSGRGLLVTLLLIVMGVSLYLPGRLLWAEFQYRSAESAFEDREFDQARLYLEDYLEAYPNSHDGHFLLAQTSRRAGFFDEAEVQLDICEYLRGESEASARERALVRMQQGDLSPETGLLRQLEGREGEAVEDLILEAVVRGYQKNYLIGKMKACLAAWLERKPDNIYALLQRGWVAERDNAHHQAVTDYNRVLELKPDHAEARLRRGQALLFLKQASAALKDLEIVHHNAPDDPPIGVALAECLAQLGRSEEAAQLLDRLLVRHPRDSQVLLARGRLALDQGQPEQAENWLRQAVAGAPRDHATMYAYARCLKRLGKEAEGNKALATLKDIESDLERMAELTGRLQKKAHDPDVRCEIGKIFLRSSEYKEGVLWLESALRADPSHRPTHQALADYYAQDNQPARAAQHRRRAG